MIRWVACGACKARLELECGLAACEVVCPHCNTAVAVPASEVGPGITVGGFAIEKLISVGGMGKLFLARQLSMDRLVALKILPPQFCAERENIDRFLNEIKVAARLQHPNVVSAYEAGNDEGVYYLAMQYIDGQSLAAKIKTEGALKERDALRIARKLAAALAYGWDMHGIVHRDVKPENILIDSAGEPRLVDMGISRSVAVSMGLTAAGTIMGTPNYMSPEQIEDLASADLRSDMFSLGTTLYHAVTAQMPFEGRTVMQILQQMAADTLPDPRTMSPDISRNCVDLLRIMMARKPEHRHQSWKELIKDMDRVFTKFPVKAPVPKGKATMIRARDAGSGAGGGAPSTVHISHSDLQRHRGGAGGEVAKKSLSSVAITVALALAVFVGLGAVGWKVLRENGGRRLEQERVAAQEREEDLARRLAAALVSAQDSTSNYEETKAKLIALQQDSAGTDLAGRAERELRKLTQSHTLSRDVAWQSLRGQADLLFTEGKTEESLELLRNYEGEFAEEMGSFRAEHINVLEARAERQRKMVALRQASAVREAEADLNRLVENAAAELLAGRCSEVAELVKAVDEGGGLDVLTDQWPLVRDRILAVSRMNEAILNSFKKSIGVYVTVGLKEGPQKLRIRKVRDGQVVASLRAGQGATVTKSFTVADLDTKELFKRAAGGEDGSGVISQGLIAAWAQAYDSAQKCFGKADCPLAKALGRLTGSRKVAAVKKNGVRAAARSSREEQLAQAAFDRLLESIHYTSRGHPAQDADAITRLGLSSLVRGRLKNEARAFKKKHGSTKVAETQAPILAAMIAGQSSVQSSYGVGRAPVALAALRKSNPGMVRQPVVEVKGDKLTLDISGDRNICDISALKGLPIASLNLTGTGVADLSPLTGMPLTRLDLTGCRSVTDLDALKGMRLRSLVVQSGHIRNIDVLKDMPLRALHLYCPQLGDIAAVSGMRLSSLALTCPRVSDLSMLRGMPLSNLHIPGSGIRSLEALRGLPLTSLNIADTRVSDLTPLTGMPLQTLNIVGTRARDLEVLESMPLQTLRVSTTLKDLGPVADVPNVEQIAPGS